MKKRILSLFLALVTVFYILPIGAIPAIALGESEETGIDVADMEVGKLYSAKWVSDEFMPFAAYKFATVADDGLTPISKSVLDGVILTVVRESNMDVGIVGISGDADWLGEYSEYRYLYANHLTISDGDASVEWNDMAVGKNYTAIWSSDEDIDVIRRLDDSETFEYIDYSIIDPATEGFLSTSLFPDQLIVELVNDTDPYVHVVNEDWPIAFDAYRYLDPEYDVIVLEELPQPKLTYNGEEVSELTLYDDGKMPLKAVKPEEISADVDWSWEILVDKENKTWARIYDKTSDVCNLTYALVKNVLDENDQAKVRAVANDGKNEYKSDPVTISLRYVPRPMDKEDYENVTAFNEYSAKSYASREVIGNKPSLAADDSTAMITITVEFIKVRPDGTKVEGSHHDKRTLRTDYEAYTIELPPILGYYPSLVAPSDPYDFADNPAKDTSLTSYTVNAGLTADTTITIYYYPGTANYTVYHYKKNVYDDNYTQFGDPQTKEGVVDKPIDDCHLVGDAIPGFYHLYYEHTEVAADGSTVIEIHYDREYYSVLFYLEKNGAYGQENLYVQYETEVGINDAQCQGWTFNFWELIEGNPDPKENLPAGRTNIVKITDNVRYKADWTGAATTYSIVYWLENANDGNYSIWWSSDPIPATSGGFAEWDKVIPAEVENKPEYKYVSLNSQKTNEEMYKDSSEGVLIEGDGSTTVDVYFNRRTYNITFEAQLPAVCPIEEHYHGDGKCEFNPIFCPHIHTGSCVAIDHEHDSTCIPTCGLDVHMHESSKVCCLTHVHTPACYKYDTDGDGVNDTVPADLEAGLGAATKSQAVDELAKETTLLGGLGIEQLNSILASAIDQNSGAEIEAKVAAEAAKIAMMAPPKNLQNGFVYIRYNVDIEFDYSYRILWTHSGTHTTTITVTAIYIDGEWYYYGAPIPSEGLTEAETTIKKDDNSVEEIEYSYYVQTPTECLLPDHDHTSGCTYVDSTTCTEGVNYATHDHTAECFKCGYIEHVHNDLCYPGCGGGESCGQHHHTADCYGNECLKPEHSHDGDTPGATVVIKTLQAKYGQDITELLPYYLELYSMGLHKNAAGENFVGWQYAGTGWADAGDTRYVKHVTMVDELCYSEGVVATAIYDATATNAYILYYLFESFDQSGGAKDYALDGSARQQLDGKWYDADPKHVQLVMWPEAGKTVDEGEKKIEGMTNVGLTTGTLNLPIGTITTETLNAYFYDRNTDDLKINIYNESDLLLTIPNGTANPLMYGLPLKQLAEALKNSEDYGRFDINNIPYPNLEAGAYVFAGWYSTPFITDHTRVDWDVATMPNGQLNIYALWEPITRHVTIYEDETLSTQFAADNHGSQGVGHRSFALEPEYKESKYYKNDYIFNGWFYKDAITGEEKAFLFNFPITQDMEIYAKWISQHSVDYRVNFVLEVKDGEGNVVDYVKVADSKEGTSIAGQNKTFRAAAGDELYDEYQDGFFPRTGSHTLQMIYDEENPDKVNEYNFIYDEVEEVPYWVRFVDESTGLEFDSSDPSYPTSFSVYTRKAAVTELFIPIEGYTVDKYSKSLILSTTDPEINNVITFYYTKNETDPGEEPVVTAPWVVNHYIQNVDGSYSLFNYIDGGDHPVGTECFGDITSIDGYSFVDAKVLTRKLNESTSLVEQVTIEKGDLLTKKDGDTVVGYGYALNMYGMEINLYYDRVKMGYTVKYQDVNTGEVFHTYNVSAENSVPHGHTVTVDILMDKHMDIVLNRGRNLVDSSTQRTWTININPALNVFTFYYEEYKSVYEYYIVCDDPDSGVGLSMTVDPVNAGESDPSKFPVGSMPYESENYYFAGWFLDEECKIPVTEETIEEKGYSVTLGKTVTIDGNEVVIPDYLTPTKTSFTYTEGGTTYNGNLFLEEQYYALFLPRASTLDISMKLGTEESLILTLTGKAGTYAEGTEFTVVVHDGSSLTVTEVPIGDYTVTFNGDWSWRYTESTFTVTVGLDPLENYLILNDQNLIKQQGKDQWLTDDAYGTVTPTVSP